MNGVALSLTLILASLAAAAPVRAGGCCRVHRCDFCGCECECESVCRLIIGTKTVPEITYSVECEEICLPGPSKCCGKECVEEIDPCTGCVQHSHKAVWEPNPRGKPYVKKRLVKIETPQQVPAYKWVTQHVCPRCAQCGCLSQKSMTEAEFEQLVAKAKANAERVAIVRSPQVLQAAAVEPIAPAADESATATNETARPSSPTLFIKSKLMALTGN